MPTFDWSQYRGNLDWLKDRTVYLVKHGSHAYGTNTPESDEDYKGVCIPPAKYYHGYLNHFEQAESNDPDFVVYEIRKFFKLAADCNPSIIEVLWVDESDILQMTPLGKMLRDNRHKFLSTKARHTFSGYAIAQLKRIKTHRAWLLNPPTHQPTREEFGLPAQQKVSSSELGAADALYGESEAAMEAAGLPKDVITLFVKERAYQAAMRYWNQYQNWKKTRNVKRADLEAKHGFDAKHAMHLVRLMRMCEEILRTGTVNVRREDKEELLAIRNGAWSYEELLAWAENRDAHLAVYAERSKLPHSPDRVALDELCAEMVNQRLWWEAQDSA